jgi:glycosyltransferase involved in cell wall biosynthesis
MQKRKRIHDLVAAFRMLGLSDVGLVLAGPDDEGLLDAVSGEGIYKVGPVYGADRLQLLASCDVYCLPGAMGLSIVDAFHCGLPVVTENVKHGPEIMYLKDSENGFIVEVGNIEALASRLRLLLTNDQLRGEFAVRAREVISGDGSIDRMCEGFVQALHYVCAE